MRVRRGGKRRRPARSCAFSTAEVVKVVPSARVRARACESRARGTGQSGRHVHAVFVTWRAGGLIRPSAWRGGGGSPVRTESGVYLPSPECLQTGREAK